MKKRKKRKVDLILSHVKHTFLILYFQIGPQVFKQTHCHCTVEKMFFKCEKNRIQGSICFKLVLGLLVLRPLSKVALQFK